MNALRCLLAILVWAVVAGCAVLVAPRPTSPVPPSPSPSLPSPTSSPTPIPAAGESSTTGCYYVWATQELPELSQSMQEAMQAVTPGSTGRAYAFGEDCVAADGTRRFLAMETDFRVKLPVQDLQDEAALGALISATMGAVGRLPQSQLAGPRPGRVEFEFVAADGTSLRLTVDIARFRSLASGVSDTEIFQLFRTPP